MKWSCTEQSCAAFKEIIERTLGGSFLEDRIRECISELTDAMIGIKAEDARKEDLPHHGHEDGESGK